MKWSLIRRKLGRVDRAIDKAIAAAEIPGAVVLARMPREGEVVEHCSVRGLASLRPERLPMARNTIFDLASLTKPLATTTAVLWLVHDGVLDLDSPVSKYLPAFSERDKDGVTLENFDGTFTIPLEFVKDVREKEKSRYEKYLEQVEKSKKDVNGYVKLAQTCMKYSAWKLAGEHLEAARDLEPKNSLVRRNLARLEQLKKAAGVPSRPPLR